MKKFLPIALAGIITASALASCAPVQDRLDSDITLASSDARTYAAWLDERVDNFPTEVILGVGSSETFGVDMSTFESDGYLLRTIGEETLIFGASTDGLDRAVRAYAKAADANTVEALDTVYHEGSPIEKLTVGGKPISDYAVVCGAGAESAAAEMSRLVAYACGYTMPVGTTEAKPAAKSYITITIVEDESLKEIGSRYKIENGNITIEATSAIGAENGVCYFLQDQLGWLDLLFGDSNLPEADHIDIPANASAEHVPAVNYTWSVQAYGNPVPGLAHDTDRYRTYTGFGLDNLARHGMYSNQWYPVTPWIQLCYTSKDSFFTVYDNMYNYVENGISSGKFTTDSPITLDLAQVDAFNYCTCNDCVRVYAEENRSHNGAVVRFTNRLAETLGADFPDYELRFKFYAYHGSNNPCVTIPREELYITFCTDGHCAVHTLDGGECFSESFDQMGWITPEDGMINNADYAEWIRGWCEMSDNIVIWYYGLDNNLHQYTLIDQLYYDVTFLIECGIEGMFFQQSVTGLGVSRIQTHLVNYLLMNPGTTEEEYYAMVDRLLEEEYGDGWIYVKEYLNIQEEAETRSGHCYNCWNYSDKRPEMYVSRKFYIENFDRMSELLEKAILSANSARQQQWCELLTVSMYYVGCAFEYFDAYDTQDTARLAVLAERYDTLVERMMKYNLNIEEFLGQDGCKFTIADNIEDEAWSSWIERRSSYSSAAPEDQRPAPERD